MRSPSRLPSWALTALVVVPVLLLGACTTPSVDAPATAPTTDPQVVGDVSAAFATYRLGVVQGDGAAAVSVLDQRSVQDMARVADLALDADEAAVRELPAAEQLLVLTYRLRPELLEADDPYLALVDAGLAGQDRSLGELGSITQAGEDLALGVITDPASGVATPLRWRFVREDGAWRFDLAGAQQLLSQAIAAGASRAGLGVDELVAATVVDLSGEDETTVEALYTELPG